MKLNSIKKTVFILLLQFLITTLSSQNTNSGFQKFAAVQDSLCVKAYEKRDDKQYAKLLNEYTVKYMKLNEEEKANYKSMFINLNYNYCCLYSLNNNKIKALEWFEKSVELGYSDYKHLLEDTDLDNIRNEAKFKTLLQTVRSVGDYQYILSRGEKYNKNDNREIPKFTYQSKDNANLIALRKYFNLDSIAGNGNEVSQIINLLHWIHNLVPHDGQHGNPEIKNAMNMVAVCKKEKRGLNCRGLSTVLNECYLSLGFKSRFLTCMPKDSLKIDQDCHVINMVYSNTMKKWLWIDPTNDAYVMNESGDLLSVEEVRDRIINKKSLILNPDANWNHKESVVKEHYLYNYMAKNLYMFSCPLSSEFDTETSGQAKKLTYVELIPLDYFKQPKQRTEEVGKVSGNLFTTYFTNNPTIFWQAPE